MSALGSQTEVRFLNCSVRFTPESRHCPGYEYTPYRDFARSNGANTTQAEAVKIRAKPTMSAVLGRSPRARTVATTPITGVASVHARRSQMILSNFLETGRVPGLSF